MPEFASGSPVEALHLGANPSVLPMAEVRVFIFPRLCTRRIADGQQIRGAQRGCVRIRAVAISQACRSQARGAPIDFVHAPELLQRHFRSTATKPYCKKYNESMCTTIFAKLNFFPRSNLLQVQFTVRHSQDRKCSGFDSR